MPILSLESSAALLAGSAGSFLDRKPLISGQDRAFTTTDRVKKTLPSTGAVGSKIFSQVAIV